MSMQLILDQLSLVEDCVRVLRNAVEQTKHRDQIAVDALKLCSDGALTIGPEEARRLLTEMRRCK